MVLNSLMAVLQRRRDSGKRGICYQSHIFREQMTVSIERAQLYAALTSPNRTCLGSQADVDSKLQHRIVGQPMMEPGPKAGTAKD
jgi:hypothetical protein